MLYPVAADIPACREVGGDAAHYYVTGNPASLADVLGEILHSDDLAEMHSGRARAHAQQFQWHANAIGVRQSLLRAAA